MAYLRPSEFNQIIRSASHTKNEPSLELQQAVEGGVDVYFIESPEATRIHGTSNSARRERILNICTDHLTIWPINIRPDKADYMLPKYGSLARLVLARPVKHPYDVPETAEEVVDMLRGLPEGFAKQFQFGLGLHWEYRFICEAIADIPDITTLCLHGGSYDAKIEPPLYILGMRRFHDLRKGLSSIASRYQRESRTDKKLLAYQSLLHEANQTEFPQKAKKLRADAIGEMADVGGARTKLSKRDQCAVVKLVQENAEELAKTEPQALLSLKADIERITLKELIERFEQMLAKGLTEQKWQTFLLGNPFILSIAFSTPSMLVQDNPYVGGARFDRRGGKIADFLLATASTGNLAIIEIKKPSSVLMTRTAYYRDDVHGPSPELGATITQILDQRFKLQKTLLNLKEESGRHDIYAYAIRCIIIFGTTPTNDNEKKSLELVRNSIADVSIVTFDELLGRLKEIHGALSPVSNIQSDDSSSF